MVIVWSLYFFFTKWITSFPVFKKRKEQRLCGWIANACRPHKRYFYHNHAVFCNSTSLNDFTKGPQDNKDDKANRFCTRLKKQRMISCFTVSSVRRCNSSKLMNREGDIAAHGSPGWRWCKPGRSLSSSRKRPQIILSCAILWGRRWWPEGQKSNAKLQSTMFLYPPSHSLIKQ